MFWNLVNPGYGPIALNEGVGVVRTLDLAGAELVTNPNFATDIAGWTDGSSAGGAVSWVDGKLRTTNTSGTARARQSVVVESGQRHAFFCQNASTVAGAIAIGSGAFGTNDYLNANTNGAIAAQAGSAEFLTTTSAVAIQVATGVAGAGNWDNFTIRKLTPTQFTSGRVFTDDFSLKADGPLGVTPDNLMWRHLVPTNGSQVYPFVASGKMAVTANGSGDTASYPYLDFGDGKVAALHCDIEWSGAGAIAMISVEPTGTIPTVANIVANSLHCTFTDTKVDITTFVGSSNTTETVTYAAPVEIDGRTYAGVGWSLVGSTLTLTLPDGTTVQRTDSKFAQVQGACAIVEIFYTGAAVGPVTISKVSAKLG